MLEERMEGLKLDELTEAFTLAELYTGGFSLEELTEGFRL